MLYICPVKTAFQFLIVLLASSLSGFASETTLLSDFYYSGEAVVATSINHAVTPVKQQASQPEQFVYVFETSASSLDKTGSNDGWTVLKAFEKAFTLTCNNSITTSKKLQVPFSRTQIIFPFHYHW